MPHRQHVPSLVIGLGGLGSQVVAGVHLRLRRMGDVPEHVVFHVLDTDTNDLNKLDGLGESVETFTQLGGGRIHRISDFRRAFPETRSWFPYGRVVNSKDTRNGAGQIRAISRLTTLELFHRPGANDGLARAVGKLRAIQARGNKNIMPRVIIVTSLAGGTGSGSFIQLALHVRELIAGRTQDSADSVTVRGFFLLPDAMIMEGQGNIPASLHDPMRANALACIKEVEAIREFASGALSSRIELEYSPGGRRRPVEVNPFNAVYLFDLENMRGEGLTRKEHYVEMMSHALHLSLFSPMGHKQLSKEDNRIRDLLDADGKNIYGSAAVAEIRYPFEDLKEYIARRWASEELSAVWLKPDHHIKRLRDDHERDLANGIVAPPVDAAREYQAFLTTESRRETGLPEFKHIERQRYLANDESQPPVSKAQAWIRAIGGFIEAEVADKLHEPVRYAHQSTRDSEEGAYQIQENDKRIQKFAVRADAVRHGLPSALAARINTRDADADQLSKGSEQHRLLYWLLDDMHPVAIRAFLYEARELLRAAANDARERTEQAEEDVARYARAYDVVSTRQSIETLTDRLDEIEGASWPNKRRLFQRLSREYATKSRRHVDHVKLLTTQHVARLVFDRVGNELDRFIAAWEALFYELELRSATLAVEVEELATRHERENNRTVRFVFATRDTKELLWKQVNPMYRTADKRNAQVEGIKAMYRAFGRPRADDRLSQPGPPSGRAAGDFVEAMIASFRAEITPKPGSQAFSQLPRNILEAMEREAVMHGETPKTVVQRYLEDLFPRAVPFLQVTRGREGQQFSFWGVSAHIEERLKPLLSESLLSAGEVQYDESFDENEILFYNVHAGFVASELSKFIPGYQDVADSRPNGRYFDAYDRMRVDSRRRRILRDKGDQEPLGSHLNKTWADMLPEFWSGVITQRVDRALVKGLATGLLKVMDGAWVFDHHRQELADALVTVDEIGAMHKLRTRIELRFDMMTAIEAAFEKTLISDRDVHRGDLRAHTFVKNMLSVPGSAGNGVPDGDQQDYSLLALITELAHGTNSYDRVAEVRMERVFKTACEEVLAYTSIMTGSVEEARTTALAILAEADHLQALETRDLLASRRLLVDRLAAAKRLEILDD